MPKNNFSFNLKVSEEVYNLLVNYTLAVKYLNGLDLKVSPNDIERVLELLFETDTIKRLLSDQFEALDQQITKSLDI